MGNPKLHPGVRTAETRAVPGISTDTPLRQDEGSISWPSMRTSINKKQKADNDTNGPNGTKPDGAPATSIVEAGRLQLLGGAVLHGHRADLRLQVSRLCPGIFGICISRHRLEPSTTSRDPGWKGPPAENALPSRAAVFMPELRAPEPVPGAGVWCP